MAFLYTFLWQDVSPLGVPVFLATAKGKGRRATTFSSSHFIPPHQKGSNSGRARYAPNKTSPGFLGTKASHACAAAGLPQKTITALRAVTVYQVSKPKTKKDLHNDHSGSLGAVTVYQVKNPLFKERLNMCIPNRALNLRSNYHTHFQNQPGMRREITPNNIKREIFAMNKRHIMQILKTYI